MPTVTGATKGNEAQHGNFFWDVQLDDGGKAWGLFKQDINVGEEVVIAYEKDGKRRVKRPEKDQQASSNGSSGQGNRGGGKSFDADPRKLRAENMRSALHASIAFWTAQGDAADGEMVLRTAEFFYDAIEAKAQVGGSTGASDPESLGGQETTPPVSGAPVGPSTAAEVREHLQGLGIDHDLVRTKLGNYQATRLEELSEEQLVAIANWAEDVTKHDSSIPF